MRAAWPWLLLVFVLLGLAAACDEEEGARPPAAGAKPAPRPERARESDGYERVRARMVETQIVRRGVEDERVLAAMRAVPRHRFVPTGERAHAYEDRPLPIGEDQTISQPYVVASMTEELDLQPGEKVLEIGTGSGYQAAVLAEITDRVYTIEIKRRLADRAAIALRETGYPDVRTRCADGYTGWEEMGPFDAILVTAAAPHVPPPLVRQLKPGGVLVLPVGPAFAVQDLRRITKDEEGRVRSRSLYAVRFVPLTGSLGGTEESPRD